MDYRYMKLLLMYFNADLHSILEAISSRYLLVTIQRQELLCYPEKASLLCCTLVSSFCQSNSLFHNLPLIIELAMASLSFIQNPLYFR